MNVLFDLTLEVDGIGGISPGNSFNSTYLPKEYQSKAVFQAKNVTHTISSTGWTTSIIGMMRSTMGYVLRDVPITNKELHDNLKNKATEETIDKSTPDNVAEKEIATNSGPKHNLDETSVRGKEGIRSGGNIFGYIWDPIAQQYT